MTKLTTKDVLHVSELAKLDLTSEELTKFQTQLSDIVSYVEELQSVDVSDIVATSQTTGLENVYREDTQENAYFDSLTQGEALQNAKKTHNGYFVVPALLKKDQE